ncbi:high affinity cationic amino acid transporter 1-like isoform X2 [Nilaparvata lugens]|uniref:high affinity cationic amino acid transporter 1-like isoform X2 n=1 Tax=Nilaparvata lugens TaxID=108931 RepID=UPI00193E9BC9|nr:high affinity cationic amino acid transporter 1-like isoform X2 [Nilaparvata lugens]
MYSALTMNQKVYRSRIWKKFVRKKAVDRARMQQTELRRALDLIDLTTFGIANTFGLGVYVLAGMGARVAGPGICVSHFIVGVATTITALCYGELAAAVPRSGSVYSYTYVLMGEFMAFIFGWLQCLENIIGVACLGGGLSTYIDNMIDNKLADYFAEINIPVVLAEPNVFAAFLIAICSSDLKNWSWKPGDEDFPTDGSGGSGGFFPFGFHGVLVITRHCVYAYRGFEGISCAGEEAKNPRKLIPLAILLTLIIASVSYIGVAVALTLMWPYFDESITSPFPYALDMTNMHNVKWVVSTGILFCLCACLLGNTYTCTRVLYSMGADGLILKWFGKVNSKTKTPIFSTVATALLSGAFAIILGTDDFVRTIVSIVNLVSHTVVSVCVLLLRYRNVHEQCSQHEQDGSPIRMEVLLNLKAHSKTPTAQSYLIVKITILIMCLLIYFSYGIGHSVENTEKEQPSESGSCFQSNSASMT